ncbi:nuclear transport factor 2 family protein [Mucilaginibacter flavus]|uniref:nuclear transport factor 2 family protein n=1 Tax=Mucilaginibacter flavus TaxID=931504 RepID=UPI0025B3F5B5|nr:nuclear transport factor 2 family protein [Mucilaginibacter flavus]MDN3583882.1 nuclear transport factor 2 family protein [Mucilaginibacter flavus]
MQDIINNKTEFEHNVQQFIAAANLFDTQAVLNLFAADAVIEDISVGGKFEGTPGIKKYFVNFFIDYHTATQVLLLEHTAPDKILLKVDFTGDFGHETGGLNIRFNEAGLISSIDAYLD